MRTPVALAPTRLLGVSEALIWAGQRLRPGAPVANTANLYRIAGQIDGDRFVAAFDTVVRASDALRTVITDVGGAPHPHVRPHPPAVTTVIDLAPDEVDEWATQRVSVPLVMETANYDSVLIRHDDDDWSWYLGLHHVIVDAWGATLVFRATAAAYHGEPLDLPSFAHYRAGLDAQRDTDAWREARSHWAGRAVTPTPTTFYADGPETTRSYRLPVDIGAARRNAIDRRLDDDFKPLSRDLGMLAMLTTTTVAYLFRLSGRRQVRIGVPVHHRSDDEARATIGLCMELFPVAVDVEPDDTLRTLHTRVTATLFDLLRHARPGTSARPDFDVVLNVITASSGPFGALRASAQWVHSGHVDPAHRLRVQYFDFTGTGEATLALDLNEAVADDDHRRFAPGHFRAVLDTLVDDPDTALVDVVLVGDEEREQLLVAYNTTAGPPAAPTWPVVNGIVGALRDAGETAALVEGDLMLSGSEVADRIEALAGWLAGEGIGPGDRVGIHMTRSADAVLAIAGVVRAGAAFVPLDPGYPPARREHIVADAGLALVLDALPSARELAAAPAVEPRTPSLDDEAYVLYTSGSTGLPKGVPISHRGLSEYLAFARDAYLVTGEVPVTALFTSLSFDLTITSLFLPLLTGTTMVVFGGDGPSALRALAADRRVTFLKATPSHLELLVRMLPSGHRLRTVVVGGEAFSRSLAERLREAAPGVAIFDEYGPTEAVVGCMIHRYDPARDLGPDVPIGRPAPGVRLHVLDERRQLVPRGVPGELYVSRPGLAAGYLNRPELSAERFVDLDHLGTDRAYRTGDLVRLADSTTMAYLGRLDDQLKVGGIRLEPAEVEAALRDHPRISQAAVRLWTPNLAGGCVLRCTRCGIGSDVPGVVVGDDGTCSACGEFDAVKDQAEDYFGGLDDLRAIRDRARGRRRGSYDALHLLSGGKDSTYALYRLVELGFDVRALTLDNGFISEGAKDNVRRAVADLGVDHDFVTTDAMNEIFRDSLERYSNVCNGCYKTIYTLAVNRAHELGIPLVVTGLSRGQFFETRLTPGQFARDRFDPDAIDAAVLAARKVYHRTNDAVSRLLDVSLFDDDAIFDEISFVDFYRYCDVELADMLAFLAERAPWIRPTDTGRSTNCLINAAGIAVHKAERGFHNYAVPYSWDVRVGHKQRDEAIDELDDPTDDTEVARLLAEVGYQPRIRQILTAWYVSDDDPPVDLDPDELAEFVADRVPAHAVPAAFVRVDELPLSPHGKLATDALPPPTRRHRDASTGYLPPVGPIEETLCEIWASMLGLDRVGADDDFFDLGGTSLDAVELAVLVGDTYGIRVPEDRTFIRRTVRELAREVEVLVLAEVEAMDDDAVARELRDG